jgi:hypothetical protein
MSKTEQELREWCEGVEADNDTLRRAILRLNKERDEFKELAKDSMRLAERCASKCEELKAELEHAKAVANHRLSVLADRGLALNKIDPFLDMKLSHQYPLDPNMMIYIKEANQ